MNWIGVVIMAVIGIGIAVLSEVLNYRRDKKKEEV